jgi:hypothetical protein
MAPGFSPPDPPQTPREGAPSTPAGPRPGGPATRLTPPDPAASTHTACSPSIGAAGSRCQPGPRTGFFSALLGEYQQARALDEDTLARRRQVLGDDHPDTLISAHNLAADLRTLGKPEET